MIYGKLATTGVLTDVYQRIPLIWPDGSIDVPLVSMPSGYGPFGYDAAAQTAFNSSTVDNDLSNFVLDTKVLTALALQASLPPGQVPAWVKPCLDSCASKVFNLIGARIPGNSENSHGKS